eukprot:239201-Amphidinium_carterae.2
MGAYCYLVLPEAKVKKILAHDGDKAMSDIKGDLQAVCDSMSGRRLFWSAYKKLATESVAKTMTDARLKLAQSRTITEAYFEQLKKESVEKIQELVDSAGLDERRDVSLKYFGRDLLLRISHHAELAELELTAELREIAYRAGDLDALPPQAVIEKGDAATKVDIPASMLMQAKSARKTLLQFLADEGENESGEKLLVSRERSEHENLGVIKTHSRELRTKDPGAWKLEEAYLKDVCSEGRHVQEQYTAELVPTHGTWRSAADAMRRSTRFQSLGMYKWAPTGDSDETHYLAHCSFA